MRSEKRASKATICFAMMLVLTGAYAQPIVLEPGFQISHEAADIPNPTQLVFSPDGRLLVATRQGTIFEAEYGTNGIVGDLLPIANNVGATLLGICFHPDGSLFASSNDGFDDSGFLAKLLDLDSDGYFETQQRFVVNLPNAGHHNNQLALNGSVVFVGMGSRTDDGKLDDVEPTPAATVLHIDLNIVDFDSSTNLPDVHAFGFRNPFGIALDDLGRLWLGDNGQDEPILPESVHLVEPAAHHGFPANLAPPESVQPIALLGLGTSANGLDLSRPDTAWGLRFARNLFIARFDYELNNPLAAGMDVVRIAFDNFAGPGRPKPREISVFARGFWHPLDVEIDPFGNLLVLEFGSYSGPADGAIYRISRSSACVADFDADGVVTLDDLTSLLSSFGRSGEAAPIAGDCDGDRDVDINDLTQLLSAFGNACL